MMNTKRRTLSGLLSGVLGVSAVAANAQEPASPEKPEKPAAPAAEPAKPAAVTPAVKADDPKATPADVAAAPADAVKTDSGLAFKVLKKGTGTEKPSATDTVKVHYSGWKASDGKLFDSSYNRGVPAEFQLNQVIKGWTEGVQLMVVGEKRRFWIPSALAYGDNGRVAGDLTFDIELLEIVKPPEAPKDLVAPADAEKTESGLASKVLKEGEGDAKPTAEDVVTVQFTGWKADGEFLTTSKGQARPAQFKLDQLQIEGWKEGIQLMKKGEQRRFWIPAKLAFGDTPPEGAPKGDLIFDFELIDFRAVPKPPPPPKDPNAPEDVAGPPEGTAKTESGISHREIKAGEGEAMPKLTDLVEFNFKGWDSNGSSIGSSTSMGGKPMKTVLEEAFLPGWKEAIQLMKKGETRRFWIPEELGFPGGNGPKGTLTFDIELISFKLAPAAPEVPSDVAAPPADALKTESGLAYKVLNKGTGEKKITEADRVMVHYAGWMTDGKMFDSSIPRDELFEVNMRGGVIPGWLEGLKLMVKGEKTRFWIPANLAYGETPRRPGGPAGLLVFDIEVVDVISPTPRPKIEAVTPPIEIPARKPSEKAEKAEEKPAEKEAPKGE